MLHLGKIPPSKMNLGIFQNFWKTTSHLTKTSIILKVPTSSTLPPNYSIRAKGSTSQSLYFEPWAEKPLLGARAAWKSWFSWFFRFSPKCSPGWSPTRNWEIRQRNRNWMGVGSNDTSFNAWSRKNTPVENELGDFSQSWKNYPSPYKNLNYFKGAN